MTGQPLPAVYQERIIRPLGLAHTAYDPQGDIRGPHARGYLVKADGSLADQTAVHWGIGAEGGIVSDAADTGRFLVALMQDRLLGPVAAAGMRTGDFWSTADTPSCGGSAWRHSGAGEGYKTNVWVSSDGRRVVVLLLNGGRAGHARRTDSCCGRAGHSGGGGRWGLLSAASLAGKGAGGFARGRLVRLGVPLLGFVVLIDPLTDSLGSLAEGEHPRLWAYLVDQTGTRDTGPLWFVALLLLLSLAYAAWRRLRPARVGGAVAVDPRYLVAVAAGIAVGSFVVRLGSPLGAETFANLRWEAWPQGIALFTLGVLAGERGWLEGLDQRLVGRCGWLAMAGALALVVLAASALVADRPGAVAGGFTWQAAALAVLEGAVAVALSLWVVAWFRRRWDHQGPLVQRAGRGSYGAYVLHPPALVALSLLARPLAVAPEAKFVLVAGTGVVVAFAVGIGLTHLRVAGRLL